MDMNQWKLVLFDWVCNLFKNCQFHCYKFIKFLQITATGLIDVFGSLEHVQLDDFFFNFYHKIHSEIKDSIEEKLICDFLKGRK